MPGIGHVHLKVSDIERSVEFYERTFGLELQQKFGNSAAFLSFNGYHHHLGLNVWQSRGSSPAPERAPGLFHFAILYETVEALSAAVRRVMEAGVEIDGAADHGVSLAVYLRDPDQNGIEIYWDRPRDEWPKINGELAMVSDPLDLNALLALSA